MTLSDRQPTQVVIGTAGHIDHGKTSLVLALTGTNTDRLAEEKARGMTIDIGFAFLNDNVTIIDVPGHEKFIRNMVAGVATIDVALMVIAADDGIMPQTLEHLHIMDLLGIQSGVIALTKIDLVEDPDWLDLVEEDLRQSLKETMLENAPIIRTSISDNHGIEDLRKSLLEAVSQSNRSGDRGYFRLPVDRIFSKSGFGTVVTGTVISGSLSVGDTVEIQPGDIQSKVRGIQSHGMSKKNVSMGDRAAINLVGIEKSDLSRGTEVTSVGRSVVTNRFIGDMSLLKKTAWKVKNRQRLRIHFGTTEVMCRVWLSESPLEAGQSAKCIFMLEESVALTMDDRFIIRSFSPMETLGGGKILDPKPNKVLKRVKKDILSIPADFEDRFLWFVRNESKKPKSAKEWSIRFQQSQERIDALIAKFDLKTIPGTNKIYHPEDLNLLIHELENTLDAFHEKHPYRPFLGRKQFSDSLNVDAKYFEYAIKLCLENESIQAVESGYALSSHSISLSKNDESIAESILAACIKNHFEPFPSKSIAEVVSVDVNLTQELLHVLKGRNLVIEMSEGWWLSKSRFDELVTDISNWFDSKSVLTVSDFKDLTDLTRKTAIPLFEYLDKIQITERKGNDRIPGEKLKELMHG